MIRKFLVFAFLAVAFAPAAFALPQWTPVGGSAPAKSSLPAHLRGLAELRPGSVTELQRGGEKASSDWTIALPDGTRLRVENVHETRLADGNITIAGTVAGALYPVLMTVGPDASFGLLHTPNGTFRFESWGDCGWLIDVDDAGLGGGAADQDFVKVGAASDSTRLAAAKAGTVTIDVLFVYTASFAARYPGTALATRIDHLIAVANQVMANSGVAMALRSVGNDLVGYSDSNSNEAALAQLRDADAGRPVAGLETIAARRTATGADLVTLIRPHDIETRGTCGIAYLFSGKRTEGFNVISDGFDGWSLCDDAVYAHEVGHNLGAEHQIGFTSQEPGFATAFVVPGQFHTVMGSFGSGHPDRNRGLLQFSDPTRRCGGVPCGIPNVADNARRLRETVTLAAGFAATIVPGAAAAPAPLDADTDGDGVPDSADAFPFDATAQSDRDGDGAADDRDTFPDNRAESGDIDGDGIGDNADTDRDGDGVANTLDPLPNDPAGASDGDGDRVADAVDAFPQNRNESIDTDHDGVGDNADADSDNDGAADVAPANTMADVDLLAVSGASVVRLDGATGLYGGIEFRETHVPQAFGPRAALAWDAAHKRVLALVAGDVRRYARDRGAREATLVESYPGGPLPGLPSGLAAGFAIDADGTLYVGDSATLTLRRFDAVTGVERPGGVFGDTPFFDFPPRALAVAPGRRLWTLDRGGRMREVDVDTGAALRSIVPRINGAQITNPSALIVAPDAALLASESGRDRIVRIDPANPAGATVLVTANSGGLDAPNGMAFGPDGRLYVASGGTGSVLRYDASGAFVDVFSHTPPGALETPRALAFAPKVRDRFPLDSAHRFRPIAGGWSNAARPGHGIDLQSIGSDLVLTWYTYDRDGNPTWYLAVGALAGADFDQPLMRGTWDGTRTTLTPIGRARLHFESESQLRLDYTVDGFSGSEPMLPVIAGMSNETQFPTAAWYAPADSGWGISLSRNGEFTYAVAFVYDTDGAPTWAIGGGPSDAAPLAFAMSRPSGPCPQCDANAPRPASTPLGELRFSVIDASRATMDLRLENADVSWLRGNVDMVRATDSPTQPDGTRSH